MDQLSNSKFTKDGGYNRPKDTLVNNPSKPSEEVFNMAIRYLENLNLLILNYAEFRYKADYENMYITLDLMENILSPKVDNDDVEKNLDWIENHLESWKHIDENGRLAGIYPKELRLLKLKLKESFRLLMLKMQERNLLSPKVLDPTEAMKEFE